MARIGLIRVHPKDNVAVAGVDLSAGHPVDVDGHSLTPRQDIPAGHKLALVEISSGQPVVKYGEVIGHATQDIHAGDWVHVHNLTSARSALECRS